MAAKHSPAFLQLVEDAKSRVRELTVDQVKAQLDRGDGVILVYVPAGVLRSGATRRAPRGETAPANEAGQPWSGDKNEPLPILIRRCAAIRIFRSRGLPKFPVRPDARPLDRSGNSTIAWRSLACPVGPE